MLDGILHQRAHLIDRPSSCSARSRRRDCIELVGIYGLLLILIWTPLPWQGPLWAIAIVTAFAVLAFSWEDCTSMGLRTDNLLRALWAVPFSLAIAAGAILVATRMHTLHIPGDTHFLVRHFGLYALWAALQQLMLQCFFLARSLRLLPNATAAAGLSAGLFALAHVPNPVLTVITLVCGLASCFFFLHYRNLLPLFAAHAILGIAIAITVPNSVNHNMRVGLGYLTYTGRPGLTQAAISPKP